MLQPQIDLDLTQDGHSLSAEKGIVVDHVYALYDLLLSQGVKKLRLNTRHVEVR